MSPHIDDFTLKTDRTSGGGDGTYETTEAVENFTIDDNGYAPDDFTHDAAGNLTYDGVYQYAYDAWNRQVRVTKCTATQLMKAQSLRLWGPSSANPNTTA